MKIITVLCMMSLFVHVTQQQCTSKVTSTYAFGTIQEFYAWDLREQFFTGNDLTYEITTPRDNPWMSIQKPIEPFTPVKFTDNRKFIINVAVGSISAFAAMRAYENGVWQNDYAFIEEDALNINLFFAQGFPKDMEKVPTFTTKSKMFTAFPGLKCLALDYTFSRTQFLVDCLQVVVDDTVTTYWNGFFLFDALQIPTPLVPTPTKATADHPYKEFTTRQTVVHQYKWPKMGGAATTQILVFRGAPATALPGFAQTQVLDTDSYIEVFKLDPVTGIEDTPVLVIDKKTIGNAINDGTSLPMLRMIKFKVMPDSNIFVCDAYAGIYKLRIDSKYNLVYQGIYAQPIFVLHYDFDFNYRLRDDGSYDDYLVVLHANSMRVYMNGRYNNGYTLPAGYTAAFGDTVSISQKYIVVRQTSTGKTMLYSSDTNLVISQGGLSQPSVIFVNPYEPDIIGLSSTTAYRYKISNGFLILNNPPGYEDDTDMKLTLKATAVQATAGQTVCTVDLYYRIMKKDDGSVLDTKAEPFPSVFSYPSDPISLKQIASGPAIHYDPVIADKSSIKYTVRELEVLTQEFPKGVTFPSASDIIYADMISQDNNDVYYLFVQTKDKNCQIFQCIHDNLLTTTTQCVVQHAKFAAPVALVGDNSQFAWYLQYGMIHFIFKDGNKIQICTAPEEGISCDVAVDFTGKADTIISFTLLENQLYLVLSNTDQTLNRIEIYEAARSFVKVQTINAKVLQGQGYNTVPFYPTQVFGNKMVKSQLIYIRTNTDLLIADYNQIFTLIDVKPLIYDYQTADIAVAIGRHSFFVVTKHKTDPTKDTIGEYDFRNINDIKFMKNHNLYGATIQSPLQVDYSSETGYAFVRVKKGTTTQIMLIEPLTLQHQSLYKLVDTKTLVPDGTHLIMTIDGSKQIFIYFNNGKEHQVVGVFPDPQVFMSPNQETGNPAYVNKATVEVKCISSLDTTKFITHRAPLTLLNTQSSILIDRSIKKKNQVFPIKNQETEQRVSMGNDWFQGQVASYTAECTQCGDSDDVQLEPPVYPYSSGAELESYDISTGSRFSPDLMVYQTRTQLVFQNVNTAAWVKTIDLLAEVAGGQFTCTTLTASGDGRYIFSACYNIGNVGQTENFIILHVCNAKLECTMSQNAHELAEVQFIAKMQFIDNTVILLDSSLTDATDYKGKILTFRFQLAGDLKTFTLVPGAEFSGEKLKIDFPVYINDFDLHKFTYEKMDYYKLVFTSAQTGLITVDVENKDGLLTILQSYKYNLVTYLTETAGQYVKQGLIDPTVFQQVKIIYSSLDKNVLKMTSLVTTNNVAQYGIHTEFKQAADGSWPLDTTTRSVPCILNQYGNWKALNIAAAIPGYVAIAYTNLEKTKVLIGVYKLPEKLPTPTLLIPFVGSVEADYFMPQTQDFALNLEKDSKGTVYLFANIHPSKKTSQEMLIKYAIQDAPSLFIKNGKQLKDQTMKLTLANAFGSDSIEVPISNHGVGSSSSNWWWITLIVVFSVLLVGGGGFFVYTKYFKRAGVDPLLG